MEVASKYESLSVDYFLLSFEERVLPIFSWISAICDQVSEAALFMRKDRAWYPQAPPRAKQAVSALSGRM